MIDYHFDCFRLVSRERRLEKSGTPVKLGHRALDVLFALVEQAGEVVPKCDLMARAWPSTHVDENSLRVQIAGLRKTLAEHKTAEIIQNIPGRGYCFTLPVERVSQFSVVAEREAAPNLQDDLPSVPDSVIGRDDAIEDVLGRLCESRLVTIVGPGGMGKTMVAITVARRLRGAQDTVLFVDLGSLPAGMSIAAVLAARLKQPEVSGPNGFEAASAAGNRRTWLVLDGCEHLLADAAKAAERIVASTPHIRILATSREALRAVGERVVQLEPLRCPPERHALPVHAALSFPALRLLAARAGEASSRFEPTESNVAALSVICRKLDGNPLALEIAGSHTALHGPDTTLAMLDGPESLRWLGRRTAPARQQRLEASLDWSFQLLSAIERKVFLRLGVFSGPFERSAALAVVIDAIIDHREGTSALDALVAKSLVLAAPEGPQPSYRLSLVARLYALERLSEHPCATSIHERRAIFRREPANVADEGWTPAPPGRVVRHGIAGDAGMRAATATGTFHALRAPGASRPATLRALAVSASDTT